MALKLKIDIPTGMGYAKVYVEVPQDIITASVDMSHPEQTTEWTETFVRNITKDLLATGLDYTKSIRGKGTDGDRNDVKPVASVGSGIAIFNAQEYAYIKLGGFCKYAEYQIHCNAPLKLALSAFAKYIGKESDGLKMCFYRGEIEESDTAGSLDLALGEFFSVIPKS